ncbi:MAG: MFS transporter [Frankiaceae bacterium]|jgi:EmrB/QacA subfamily drug resistance transporter|nr:MFS transporter [Frankiaceae bacterium]
MSSATASVEPRTPAAPAALTHRQILSVLSGLLMGMFLAALDQTIVTTAIRTIGDDLHGLSAQAWVTTAFMITSTISTPLYGKLSDILGRKPLFLAAISIFMVGSALCTFSTSMYTLAAFRALQGIGAGGLMSMAFAIMADVISPRERAKYQGYFMAVFGTSSVLGPVVGGALAGAGSIFGLAGWRWIFLINVPLGLVALAVVNRVLRLPHMPVKQRIDWWGAALLAVGLVPLLIVAEQGRLWGWAGGRALACYAIGGIALAGFFATERRMGDAALLPLRLFGNRTFAIGAVHSLTIGAAMLGGTAVVPLYMQIARGATPTESGLLMLPMVIGTMSASMVSGRWTSRTGRYRMFPIIGSIMLIFAFLWLSRVGATTPLWYTDIGLLMTGAGMGLNMQTIILAVQNAVPPRDMGVATSSTTFFRSLGGTLGTAVFLSVLFSTVGPNIVAAFRKAGTIPAVSPAGVLNDSAVLNRLPRAQALPFQQGFSTSMSLVFLVVACLMVLLLLISLLLQELPLRSVAGMQAAHAEAHSDATGGAGNGDAAGGAGAGDAAGSAPSDDAEDDAELDEPASASRG